MEQKMPTKYALYQGLEVCPHCDQNIRERNPTGYCDHLYYPYLCDVCKDMYSKGGEVVFG
jgi:hypothetical protein